MDNPAHIRVPEFMCDVTDFEALYHSLVAGRTHVSHRPGQHAMGSDLSKETCACPAEVIRHCCINASPGVQAGKGA